MMVIQTRYRDIDWEEVQKCLTQEGVEDNRVRCKGEAQWNAELRGRSVEIITPADSAPNSLMSCEGPLFFVNGRYRVVCPHIAEIGD